MKDILVVFVSLIIINSCGNSPTENKPNYKDPFTMTWSADTITYPGSAQILMRSIWASSPNDAWVVGHNDRSKGNVWHFNGTKWDEIDPLQNLYKSPNSYTQISASSPSDIWFVGSRKIHDPISNNYYDEDLIIQYKNGFWVEHDLNTNFRILSVYCASSTEIWICGDKGFVAKYDGNKWQKDTIQLMSTKESSYFLKGIAKHKDKLFVLVNFDSSEREKYYYIYGEIKNWTIADTNGLDLNTFRLNWGNLGLHIGENGKLYSYGSGGVWQWENGWKRLLDVNSQIWGIKVLSDDYIIACGIKRSVYYYNGAQWKTIEQLKQPHPDTVYQDAWTDGKEIIVIGILIDSYPQKTIIWRGK